jgi:acetylornithine deacetylase/succinyl-diaminopimelate desuccinylase-like protein
LYTLDAPENSDGINTAFNAHIDVVAPYFPPKREGDKYLYGRGSIDDKGGIASIIGALKIINKLQKENRIELANKFTGMFVIEEETGGNGSLSLAIDKELKKRYDSLVVLECAGNQVYPGNLGAVWVKSILTTDNENVDLLEAVAAAVLQMQVVGLTIKSESKHPLFPHRPVQTCNGILGPFGEHPSRICGKVVFEINGSDIEANKDVLETAISAGCADFVSRYGDKTKVIVPETGKPKVEKHYSIDAVSADKMTVSIYGSTGHMGSILENDDAIMKWALVMSELIALRDADKVSVKMNIPNFDTTKEVVLEGGQGFLPTHDINDVMERMRQAAKDGVKTYLTKNNIDEDAVSCVVSYDKLHNAAFGGHPDSKSYKNVREAAVMAGLIKEDDVVRGWDVSCDARLFATEFPELPIITTGAGALEVAHADNEHLVIEELLESIHCLVLFMIKETGSKIL